MFDKKKLNFWRLAFAFGAIVSITLILLWGFPHEPAAQMTDSGMGNMMKQMHVSNMTIDDLLGNSEDQSQMSSMHNSQTGQSLAVIQLNFISTSAIFLLLPLIIGGSIILAIVWYK